MLYIIGGDSRIGLMAEKLLQRGCEVAGFGLSSSIIPEIPLTEGLRAAEAVILGIPSSRDGETVFAPFYHGLLPLSEFFRMTDKKTPVFCGLPDAKTETRFAESGHTIINYLQREELALLNAVPTAEGAIEIAMREMPRTIWNSNVLVAGFGRCGQYLARALSALGAHVSVTVRRSAAAALARTHGFSPVYVGELQGCAGTYDVIFNTVPHCIFDSSLLPFLRKDCLLVDLASLPGGVDTACAEELGIQTVQALSLPGKVAPVTAAEILCDIIENIRSERN